MNHPFAPIATELPIIKHYPKLDMHRNDRKTLREMKKTVKVSVKGIVLSKETLGESTNPFAMLKLCLQ